MRLLILAILLSASALPANAQEFYFSEGYVTESNPSHRANGWELSYVEGLSEHLALRLGYLNQGHFPLHHRDSHSASLWLRTNTFNRHLSLSAGVGALYYYDTTNLSGGSLNTDVHGFGLLTSVAATWYTKSRILFQVSANWINADTFDTVSAFVGIGYQLDPPSSTGPLAEAPTQTERTTENEVTVFGGETIVNISGPGHSGSAAIEYRRGIWKCLEWTVGGLYEGNNSLINRYGLTTQIWLARPFLHDRVALGIGGGAYFNNDRRRINQENDIFISKLATISASYRMSPHFHVRFSWDRVITNYNRDSDVFLGGIGYRF